ncbi:hypothetical protein PsorP6_012552 [Peronosclerospora sorghi]|uniref:Uncharacterized protein n=1 Tax=Peronosclerospora sorghi TaxID=230839 RepID=A0ACC0WFI8_9STRA|nr:hypothetical protein PsorP6_012552 [Peronosclerospora sorghi]
MVQGIIEISPTLGFEIQTVECKESYWRNYVEQELPGATLLIFANKQDFPRALSSAEIADALSLRPAQFASRHWKIISCSAATGDGLAHGIEWLVNDVSSRIFLME